MSTRTRAILIAVFGFAVGVALIPAVVIAVQQRKIVEIDAVETPAVVIVFGAGLRPGGTPSDVLLDRVAVTAGLYEKGLAKAIIVSGDNTTDAHNEPEAMQNALIGMGVPAEDIHMDFAGRRTYDTCKRAHELWGVEHAILVTQSFHLPRAIWTCEHLGIKSTGVSASLQSYVKDSWFWAREYLAIYKAAIDLYLRPPAYLSGPVEEDLD